MTAWVVAALLVVFAVALVWRFGALPRGGAELVVAAGIIGLAGYAWQATPDQPGVTVATKARVTAPPDRELAALRAVTMSRYGDAAKVVEFSDTLGRMGLTRQAVIAVRTGLRKEPRNVDLWVALGNALVVHGGGQLSPAAELAYRRGAELSPDSPAPAMFLGLALVNSNRLEDAQQVWRALLARTPPEAPWRAELEARVAALAMATPATSGPG